MKNKIFMIFILVSINFNIFSNENTIWGVWNTGDKENCVIFNFEDGSYLHSRDMIPLIFSSNDYGNGPAIMRQGDRYYKIIKIITNENKFVSIYIETNLLNIRNHPLARAKVIMHFIDNDHMWMEIDRNDKKYQTDSRFPDYRFNQGRSVVYWREKLSSK